MTYAFLMRSPNGTQSSKYSVNKAICSGTVFQSSKNFSKWL